MESPYHLFLTAAYSTPITDYLFGFSFILIVFLYNFLEIHFFEDLLTGFRGQPVRLTFSPSSQLYHHVVSKCKVLHGRYLSTPWLSSPHLQTGFVHFFGNAPVVSYRRQIFTTPDGGTLALDWVINNEEFQADDAMGRDARNPIMLIVPGLTSASDSSYIKHLAFKMAKHGWSVVVSNHRGLGGVPITSDCFYSGGWTGDVRLLVAHLHCQYPETPLFAVGTSIGANILVKYLGEDGNNVPLTGAAVICSPWDLLLCDRFMNRRLVQKLYNKALTIGLKEYAYLHEAVLSRLSNWEGVKKIPVFHANPLQSSTDHVPSVHVSEDGVISVVSREEAEEIDQYKKPMDENRTEESPQGKLAKAEPSEGSDIAHPRHTDTNDEVNPVKKHLNQISRQNRKCLWLLAYIAIFTTWPVVGPVLALFLRKKIQAFIPKHKR